MQELVEKIRAEIASWGAIPFRDFMELALYCPVCGFYEKEADIIGRQGDFYTSPAVGPLFGQLLAWQFAEWLSDLPSEDIQIVEAGAHDGTVARDILEWFSTARPDLYQRLAYWIVEPSARRRARQQERLEDFEPKVLWLERLVRPDQSGLGRNPPADERKSGGGPPHSKTLRNRVQARTSRKRPGVRWSSSAFARVEEAHAGFSGKSVSNKARGYDVSEIRGIIFSNELLDAMPVHRLGWDARAKRWFEWGVAWHNDRFAWARLPELSQCLHPAIPRLPQEIRDILPDGFTTEVCPAAAEWWQAAARSLRKGRLVTIDYGLEEEQFFAPERCQGTLRGYHRHQLVADVLADPGEQDITAHVNFSGLRRAGEACGLSTAPLKTQGQFLTEIFADMCRKGAAKDWSAEQVRQFQTLTHPGHLGYTFKVFEQRRL